MRTLTRLAALVLAIPLFAGCSIWDELNAAEELMDSMSKDSAKKKAAVAEASSDPAAPPPDPLAASKQWWKGATTVASKELDQSIVRCTLPGGRTQFMARPQCLASRGTPRAVH